MTRVVETNHGIIQNVQKLFAQRMGSDRLELWFQGNERWTLDGESLQIDFDNEFLADCVKSFCLPDLRAVAEEVLGTKARVGIGFDAFLPQNQPEEGQFPKIHSPNPHNGVKPADPVLLKQSPAIDTASSYRAQTASEFPVPIKSGYPTSRETVYRGENQESTTKPWTENRAGMKIDHWAEFIDGQCNRMAKTAAEMVLERPGNLTPLLIHGPCGVGKTHLLRAIAEQLRSRHQLRRVIYLTAEQFTIDFTDSARGSGFASFRKKYRDVDAMLIDDVQFFVGKGATLIELRNTVDNLIRSQRQVIFASDRSLGELAGIGSELHARLSGGMVCALDPLDESCRVSLLQRLCDRYSVSIRPATVETLVRQSSGDARLLHGLAFRILTAQRSMGRSLTEAEVLESCQELLRASQPSFACPILNEPFAMSLDWSLRAFKPSRKSRPLVSPACWLCFWPASIRERPTRRLDSSLAIGNIAP